MNVNTSIILAVPLSSQVPKLLCQLDQHLGCVNSVRWSCGGRFLASAGDDKVIIIWQQSSYGGEHCLSFGLHHDKTVMASLLLPSSLKCLLGMGREPSPEGPPGLT